MNGGHFLSQRIFPDLGGRGRIIIQTLRNVFALHKKNSVEEQSLPFHAAECRLGGMGADPGLLGLSLWAPDPGGLFLWASQLSGSDLVVIEKHPVANMV